MPRKPSHEEQLSLKTAKAIAAVNAAAEKNGGAIDAAQLNAALKKAGLVLITEDALAYYQSCARTIRSL